MKSNKAKIYGFAANILVSLVLISCTETDLPGRGQSLLANSNNPPASQGNRGLFDWTSSLNGRSAERTRPGTDEFLGTDIEAVDLFQVSDQGEFTLNLVGVPIEQAAQAVLGDAIKRNYTIQPGVSGTITLQTTRPLSERDLLDTFQAVLELNNATLKSDGDLITIVPLDGAPRNVGRVDSQGNVPQDVRVVAVPLKFVGTAEMTRLLQPIVGSSVEIQSIANRNVLLLSGAHEELNATIDAVNLFDVDVLAGKSVAIVPLHAAAPEAVANEMQRIFESEVGGSLEGVISFTPSQRLGAVLIVTSRSRYLVQAQQLARDLDHSADGASQRPVVYRLQNRPAAELAPILTSMLQQNAPDQEGALLESVPRVLADDSRNALIVFANDSDHIRLSQLIQSLDAAPVQVLLEVTIAEVSLTDELRFGLRYFFENEDIRASLGTSATSAVATGFSGLSLLYRGGSSAVALDALSSITDVNVLSSPSIMVIDNQEATLQIGDEVPIATQQVQDVSAPNAPIVNTISFRDTGVILRVRPRVSSSGQVAMEIEQEVSNVASTTTSGIDSPTISQRKFKTSVVVGDKQTIALGGLIEERRGQTQSGIPGLRSIPIVGAAFRSKQDTVRKTELLVLITPLVVRDGRESSAITAEFRNRLDEANGVVRTGIGTPSTLHRILQ